MGSRDPAAWPRRPAHPAPLRQAIRLPKVGETLVVALGWEGSVATVVLTGIIDDVRSTGGRGQGHMLNVSAKSADSRGKPKEHKEKHWGNQNLGTVIREAGAMAGVPDVRVHGSLAGIQRDWWGMGNESFIAFGQRLARELGATFKLRGTSAVMVPRNEGIGAGGGALATIRAAWGDNLIDWSLAPTLGRPQFKEHRVRWYDRQEAKWKEEKVEAEQDVPPVTTDRFPAADADTAKRRGGATSKEGKREKGGGSVEIEGEPAARAEAECIVIGTRPGIDGTYRIESAEHKYTRGGGFLTRLQLKQPAGEAGRDSR